MQEDKIHFKCTHGTSISSGKEILKNGFNMGNGSCGEAVYFWTGDESYLSHLAKFWATYKKNASECTVIKCDLYFSSADLLDFSSFKYTNLYAKFLKENLKKEDKDLKDLEPEERGIYFRGFIASLEEATKLEYKAFLTRHWIEKDENLQFPLEALGSPFCLVVLESHVPKKEKLTIQNENNTNTELLIG